MKKIIKVLTVMILIIIVLVATAHASDSSDALMDENSQNGFEKIIYVVIPGIMVFLSSVIELIFQSRQLKSINSKLEGTHVIINDTSDIRNAINHKLEGFWKVNGTFNKYQGVEEEHKSEGYLILSWNSKNNNYDAIYCYSVCKVFEKNYFTTAICKGNSISDIEKNKSISVSFSIDSRTSSNGKNTYNKNFIMLFNIVKDDGKMIRTLSSNFKTPNTEGTLIFERTN